MTPQPPPLPVPETDVARRQAKWMCQLSSGGGLIRLGYPGMGALWLAFSLFTIGTCAFAILKPTRASVLLAIACITVALLLYVIEMIAVRKLAVRVSTRSILQRMFIPLAVTQFALAGIVGIVLVRTTGGTLRLHGRGMSPTLPPGARLIYLKHAPASELAVGHLIFFRVNPQNTWTKQPALVVARILAAPGDQLSQTEGRYSVNGNIRHDVASFGKYTRAIVVPESPNSLMVPPDCFFVVQDNPANSLDSQVLSWVRGGDIISTDIRYVAKDGELFKKVD